MSLFIQNIRVLFKKELLNILKNKKNRVILVMPVLIQTLIFGYVATFDLNNIEYMVLDMDKSHSSKELLSHFEGANIFHKVKNLDNTNQIANELDNKNARMIISIEESFEKKLHAGQTADVQILLDGRNSNVAGAALGYATRIINNYNKEQLGKIGISDSIINVSTRSWYNPNLETRWNIMASMVSLLAVIQVIVLSGQSVATEKEQGTFDQLLVTPLSPMVILIGKALPPMFVGFAQSTIVLFISILWFNIPFAGSFILLYLSLFICNFAVIGIGLCISVFATNMQQALLYSFALLMPMILLSGFLTPVSSMPKILQIITLANPIRYNVEIAQRIYLEGASILQIYHLLLPLILIGSITLFVATKLFRTFIN